MKLRNIGGVLVVDFIDMESRRDQFQLLEHFTSAIKDDSARPQIAQLTELGLVELTRKRQGQNIYELFGKKCSSCNGLGHIENLINYQNSNLEIKKSAKKSSKINTSKPIDLEQIQVIEKQEKIFEKELINSKNLNKDDDDLNKKENDNETVNTFNSKEKKVITIELNNDEKIVYSQLGINPLIKLGKEYITSNNLVLLEENNTLEKDKVSNYDKKTTKKVSNSKTNKKIRNSNPIEDIELDNQIEVNSKKKLPKITIEDENEGIELKEDIDNSRRKRRRSSASIE